MCCLGRFRLYKAKLLLYLILKVKTTRFTGLAVSLSPKMEASHYMYSLSVPGENVWFTSPQKVLCFVVTSLITTVR